MVCLSVRLCVHTVTMATVPTIYLQLLQYVVTVQCKILKQENFDKLHVTSYTMTFSKILIPL